MIKIKNMNKFLKRIKKGIKAKYDEFMFWKMRSRIPFSLRFLKACAKSNFKCKTLLAYPEKPKIYHVIYEICKNTGWRITNNPNKKADLAIFFEDTTVRKHRKEIDEIEKRMPVLNSKCYDISKKTVDKIFKDVFGYEMSVDPRTHDGVCVRKSDTNAVHDGKVIQCPAEPEDGFVYQKLVDTDLGDGRVMDMRIHIFKNNIPFVLKRYKNTDDIFHMTIGAEIAETKDLLSEDEQKKIIEYCKRIGLDYGELDALRDNNDEKLYIVDVNNTPAGPIGPIYKDKRIYKRWLIRISNAFEQYLTT
jgi:hypothetical protein